MIAFLLTFLASGAWGRFWGGWENRLPHMFKVCCTFAIVFIISLAVHTGLYPALVLSLVTGIAFLNPDHAYGQRMGFGGEPELDDCIIVMSISYGLCTLAAAGLWSVVGGNAWAMTYAPIGFMAPLGYLFGWYVVPLWLGGLDANGGYVKKLIKGRVNEAGEQVWFIDGPTAIGEIWLRASLISGIVFVKLAVM